MKIIQNKYISYASGNRCTLLVPEFLYPAYLKLLKKYGKTKIIFSVLLSEFYKNKARMELINRIAVTIKYQEKGQDLQRIDFRPFEKDWAKLKLLAGSYNLSMCAFFVLLLMLEDAGALEVRENFSGVPPKFPKIILHQSISLYSIPKINRILHLRV